MAKFDGAKVGDRVWSVIRGKGEIVKIHDDSYPLEVLFESFGHVRFTEEGKYDDKDLFPEIYWNEVKMPTEEEDKKPFNLIEFLKENLKPKEYKRGEENYYIFFDHELKKWCYAYPSVLEMVTLYFECVTDETVKTLNENKVTPEQMKEAFKTLGWM